MDGLEGASARGFDRRETDRLLSGLISRVFLMSNAHEDAPMLFQTRWALSYLSGPAHRHVNLTAQGRPTPDPGGTPGDAGGAEDRSDNRATHPFRPTIPTGIAEPIPQGDAPVIDEERLVYRPALGATATLHYANTKARVDEWQDLTMLAPLAASAASPWTTAVECENSALLFDAERQELDVLAAAGKGRQRQQLRKVAEDAGQPPVS